MQKSELIKKIGGEFDIDISEFERYSEFNTHERLFLSGRSALAVILKSILLIDKTARTVHLPYYICDSVVKTLLHYDLTLQYYDLEQDYRFPTDCLEKIGEGQILFLVNYFGFTPNGKIIDQIKSDRPDIIVINDDVHSYWTYDTTGADYSFTSLRKHFPVIGGGLVKIKNSIEDFHKNAKIDNSFVSLKLLGATLKSLQIHDQDYLKILDKAEYILDGTYDADLAPDIVSFLFSKLNLPKIRKKRAENYKKAYELASRKGLPLMFEYNEAIIPMNVPLLVTNKNDVLSRLRSKGMFLPSYWPLGTNQDYSEQSKKLSDRQMSILIDQRYSSEDIEWQVELVKKYIKH